MPKYNYIILEGIENNTLISIDLSEDKLGDDAAKCIANYLKTNTSLKRLNLSKNQIGFEGLNSLAWALESNTTLVELDLTENKPPLTFVEKKLKKINFFLGVEENVFTVSINNSLTLISNFIERNKKLQSKRVKKIEVLLEEDKPEAETLTLKEAPKKKAALKKTENDYIEKIQRISEPKKALDFYKKGKYYFRIGLSLPDINKRKDNFSKAREALFDGSRCLTTQLLNEELKIIKQNTYFLLSKIRYELAKIAEVEEKQAHLAIALNDFNTHLSNYAEIISEPKKLADFFKLRGSIYLLSLSFHKDLNSVKSLSSAAIRDLQNAGKTVFTIKEEIKKEIKSLSDEDLKAIKESIMLYFSKDQDLDRKINELETLFDVGLSSASLYVLCAECFFNKEAYQRARHYTELAFKLEGTHHSAQILEEKLNQLSDLKLEPLTEIPSLSEVKIVKDEAMEETMPALNVKLFISTLSKALQDSLHEDRVFYEGKAGRRSDNLDRAIEVGAGAVDATGSPIVSLAVNAIRVGTVGVRNLYADFKAGQTEKDFGKINIGVIADKASGMIAKRYQDQILQLDMIDYDGVKNFALYFHAKAMDAVHICAAMKSIYEFWKWVCGNENPTTLSPEDKLFLAMISESGKKGEFLRTIEKTVMGEHWDAYEAILSTGICIGNKKYIKPKNSKHDKYGFCNGYEAEIKRHKLIPLPESESSPPNPTLSFFASERKNDNTELNESNNEKDALCSLM